MPFKYRLQKVIEYRIRKKEEQLQIVIKAQAEVARIEGLIEQNKQAIIQTRQDMRSANPIMYESYDNFLHHLYKVGEELEVQKEEAIRRLEEEKKILVEREKDIKILEKHKEKMKEAYIAEEKAAELKRLSEVAVQKHFAKTKANEEEAYLEELQMIKEGQNIDEY